MPTVSRDRAGKPVPPPSTETLTAEGANGLRTHLSLSRVDATQYLERGWVERP